MARHPIASAEPDHQGPARWARLLRAFALANDPKKVFLAALGLILLNAGWQALDRAFPGSAAVTPPVWRPLETAYPATRERFAEELATAPWRVTEPARLVVGPFLEVFAVGRGGGPLVHALLAAIWAAAVWGLVGGAIARIATVQATGSGRPGMAAALRFALGKAFALVGGPLCPMLAVALFAALGATFGLLYRLPFGVGPVVAGALLVVPLVGALLLTLVLLGLAVGWPLMHASVAAEGEDGFDCLSRTYAYVHQRPGRYAAYAAVCWLVGTAGIIVVEVFARAVLHLAQWGLGLSAPPRLLAGLFGTAPIVVEPTAATCHAFWLFGVGLLAHAWTYSYFWSAASLIYLLLRRDVDGTPFHQVALAGRESPRAGAVGPARVPSDETVAAP